MIYDFVKQSTAFTAEPPLQFGGRWSSEKLEIVDRYLRAYRNVLKKTRFRVFSIDAFAGTGYFEVTRTNSRSEEQLAFLDYQEEEVERFVFGSTRRALDVEPAFDEYIFIERQKQNVSQLAELLDIYPNQKVRIFEDDSNARLLKICTEGDWKRSRAVLFLDPFGMEVKWSMLEAIAQTGAIDVWYLFPSGIGVQRLLPHSGQISKQNEKKLDDIFGDCAWRRVFYSKSGQQPLFGENPPLVRSASIDQVESYFLNHLRTIFPAVAPKPGRLSNRNGRVLYSLCFASGNGGRGGEITLRIAKHLLKI